MSKSLKIEEIILKAIEIYKPNGRKMFLLALPSIDF